jgi:ElaB/YqjD/DUF883 family membrane-anchored ribosome-binding protein
MSHNSGSVNRLKDAAEETQDAAAANAEAAGDVVTRVASDALDVAREKGTDLWEGGRAAAAEVGEQISHHVKKHAGSSLLIAAFVGFLMGIMLLRRSND